MPDNLKEEQTMTPENSTPPENTPPENAPDKTPNKTDEEAAMNLFSKVAGTADDSSEDNINELEQVLGGDEDTVETLTAGNNALRRQIAQAETMIAATLNTQAGLQERIEAAKKSAAVVLTEIQQQKKDIMSSFAKEFIPLIDAVENETISSGQENTDAYQKMESGLHMTIAQLRTAFNAFVSPAQPAVESTEETTQSAAPVSTQTAQQDNNEPAENTDEHPRTQEELKAERTQLQEKLIAISARAAKTQNLSRSLRGALQDARKQGANAQKEFEDEKSFTIRPVVEDVIPIIDNIERGLNMQNQNSAYAPLAAHSQKLIDGITALFNKAGVYAIDPLNQPFDHNKHTAIKPVEKEGVAPDTVVEVVAKGYEIRTETPTGEKTRLIRTACVTVTV